MITVRDLWKVYTVGDQHIEAVRGINLDVGAGEFTAMIGHSGCGKSTLLAMIGGLTRPTRGSVRIDGVEVWSLTEERLAELRNRKIGFVFQFASLIPTLRAVDNVVLPALFGRSPITAAHYETAARLLEMVGLGDRLEAYPGELSGGQSRRVALARALMNRPDIILADEPTGDLDEQSEQEVMALLRRINQEQGTTLLLVTHNTALAGMARQVLRMKEGELVS